MTKKEQETAKTLITDILNCFEDIDVRMRVSPFVIRQAEKLEKLIKNEFKIINLPFEPRQSTSMFVDRNNFYDSVSEFRRDVEKALNDSDFLTRNDGVFVQYQYCYNEEK